MRVNLTVTPGFDATYYRTLLGITLMYRVLNQGMLCPDNRIVFIDHCAGSFMWNMNGYLYKEGGYSIRPKEYTTKTRSFAPPAVSTINIKTGSLIWDITGMLCGYMPRECH